MKKRKLVLISAFVVVAGAGGFFYYRYISSPEYALGQIGIAYKEHDIAKFEKYVDTKTLVGGIIDKMLDEMSKNSTATNDAEKLGENLGTGLLNLMKPQLEELWIQQISKLVETGEIQGGTGKKGLDELWSKNDTASFEGVREVKKDGRVSTISLEFNQPRFDTTLVLDIKMRDKGSHWQLFDISNLYDYTQALESLEQARVERLNEEVKREFFEYIKMSEVKLKTEKKGYYTVWYGHIYSIDFENIGDKEIAVLTCIFSINSSSGRQLESVYLNTRLSLPPGQKYTHKEEDYMSYDKVDPAGLGVSVEIVQLEFKDGSKLEWQYNWADLQKKK